MTRQVLGVLAGLAAWMAVATIAGVIMRGTWREYASVVDAMTFTLPMMIARLSIGAQATFVAGVITAFVAGRSTLSSLTTGLILLVLFIPQHIMLWAKFPVWHHLTFLLSLVPITHLGRNDCIALAHGRRASRRTNGAGTAAVVLKASVKGLTRSPG
jgi:hypothetical protein